MDQLTNAYYRGTIKQDVCIYIVEVNSMTIGWFPHPNVCMIVIHEIKAIINRNGSQTSEIRMTARARIDIVNIHIFLTLNLNSQLI